MMPKLRFRRGLVSMGDGGYMVFSYVVDEIDGVGRVKTYA